MFRTPREPTTTDPDIIVGLILSWDDVERNIDPGTGQPTFRQGRPEWRLKRPVVYRGFMVPEGFVFDVHSLPRLLRPWQPENPAWWGPPALHDWALESGLLSLKEANALYLAAMEDLGVKWIHRTAAYAGVEFARHFFPDRITRIDPDNAALVEEFAGREAVFPERRSVLRKAVFRAVRTGAGIYLKSKGIGL